MNSLREVNMQRESQSSRIRGVLLDGEWHTTDQIHRRAGFSRLNSRIAELRKRGDTIECRHIEGAGSGPEAYEYRMATL